MNETSMTMVPSSRSILLVLLLTALLAPQLCMSMAAAQDDKKDEKQESKKPELLTLKEGVAKVDGALKADDEMDRVQKNPCKVYVVDFKTGRNYKIDMVSKELDSYLRLEDATGKELAKDDDGGGFVNARVHFHCPADGGYRVICTTFGGGTGAFTLTIQEVAVAKAVELRLKDGTAKIDGELTGMDAMDAVQTRSVCKVYVIQLAKGKAYQIDMASKDVDSYLRLEDSTGKELAKDDDSGGEHNARITFSCPETGAFRIIATTYFGGVGRFTLTVKEK